MNEVERRVTELEERVEELESIINRELGYTLGKVSANPQTVECDCDETFTVNIENGLICPHCGRSADERGESA